MCKILLFLLRNYLSFVFCWSVFGGSFTSSPSAASSTAILDSLVTRPRFQTSTTGRPTTFTQNTHTKKNNVQKRTKTTNKQNDAIETNENKYTTFQNDLLFISYLFQAYYIIEFHATRKSVLTSLTSYILISI